jgi:DNA end-binding protein Ku
MMQFGLVTFPVQAYNAHAAEKGAVAFHQLHATCHRRITYEKQCPVHGPVDKDEIVLGYEYKKGKYVEIDPDEVDRLRSDSEKALTIDNFVDPQQIDPIYLDGRMYYLAPRDRSAAEPYAILLEALRRQSLWAVGQIFFSGKEQVVLVRPYEHVLHMAMLNYAVEIRNPRDVVRGKELPHGSSRNLRLAEQLVQIWRSDHFDFSHYVDRNLEKLKELIDARLEGREVAAPAEPEKQPETSNLMAALQRSVAERRHNGHRHSRHAS